MKRKRLGKEERKKQIKKVAVKLMIQKGYRNTSVREIVDKANYSAGGFYNCYSSKEELFIDILEDGIRYNNQKIIEYRDKYRGLDRKKFIIESLIVKIFEDNEYKRMTFIFLIEMVNNPDLFSVYKNCLSTSIDSFLEFCEKESLEEYTKLTNNEFGAFITSLVIGVEMLKKHEDKKYKEMLRQVIESYLDTINLFEHTKY